MYIYVAILLNQQVRLCCKRRGSLAAQSRSQSVYLIPSIRKTQN